MKVFFTASLRGKKEFDVYYQKIYQEIAGMGYEHLDNEILTKSMADFYEEMDGGREAQVELYKKKIKYLQEADICIFETSLHSLTTGFLITKAIDYNKPTIVLYYKENLPYFLVGAQEEKLILRSYNQNNLKKVLNETFEDARERRDKRFNFFISPKLLIYLEKSSKDMGITKSKFIRNLIVEHMRKIPLKEV